MAELRSSLEIFLSEEPAQFDPRKFFVTPLSNGESWLTVFGLSRRLNMMHKDIRRSSSEGVAEDLYIPVFDKIDEYRQRAVRFADVLSPFQSEYPGSRANQTLHIAMLIQGQRLHKRKPGEWPANPYEGEEALEIFQQLRNDDETDFLQKRYWGYQRARSNAIAWERELLSNRGHRVAAILREAVILPRPIAAEV